MALPKVLPNGCELLAFKQNLNGNRIVLAKTCFGIHDYATWACDEEFNTYWGHYFRTLEEAQADFVTRN